MVNRQPRRYRPLTETELRIGGFSTKVGSKFRDERSGEILTRRQMENRRVQAMGYRNYSEYQRENIISRLEQDRLYSTFEHILSTRAPGIPIWELRRNSSPEGRELRRLYFENVRNKGKSYQELLDFVDLPNEKVNQDWNEIWQRYRGYLPVKG